MTNATDKVGDVSHVTKAMDNQPHDTNAVGDVSHVTINQHDKQLMCGETPHPLQQPLLRFVDMSDPIHITANKLPHWSQGDSIQFVTFRLADSLPQTKLQEFKNAKQQWLASHPKPWDLHSQEDYSRIFGPLVEKWLDAGFGYCLLKEEKTRTIVAHAIRHFDGLRYGLHAWVIMPNHVHVLLSPYNGHLVQDIVGSWKKYTAHEINKLLKRQGSLWERESFDHMVRNAESFQAKLDYIINNPANLPPNTFTLYVADYLSHGINR